MFIVRFFFFSFVSLSLLHQSQSCWRSSAHVSICNQKLQSKSQTCKRRHICLSPSSKCDATKCFLFILQRYDGIRNAVKNGLHILFGIKECFSNLCCCERAGFMKGSVWSWAALWDSHYANCHPIMRVNRPGNEMQRQINEKANAHWLWAHSNSSATVQQRCIQPPQKALLMESCDRCLSWCTRFQHLMLVVISNTQMFFQTTIHVKVILFIKKK